MSTDALLLIMIMLPFAGAIIAAFLPTRARNAAASLATVIALAGCACLAALYEASTTGAGARLDIPWLTTFGLDLVFRLNGLSWVFAALVLGIGAMVVLYARYYMSPEDPVPRFFTYLLAFMGAMLGIIMSGNLIQLVMFWELTSLWSFLLIGYWNNNANARDGARMALTVTATGGLCMLAGMLVIGHIVGSYDIDVVLASGNLIREHALYLPALVLVLIGAFTKSAQFPFHFWLPHAMAAPTPVSAYLHSAAMVKAGIYLMTLLWPVMSGTDAWYVLVGGAGMATLLIGAFAAIFQHDLKGVLAYSTLSHLGLITLLLGLGSPLAAVAAIFHTLNHATFKASLFMAAGIIDHETGTRDLRKLSGLYRYMPITGTLAIIAAAAMAGVPLLNGFLSKEMFLAEALNASVGAHTNYGLPALATLASTFAVLYSLRFIHQSFFGPPPTDLPQQPHEPTFWMWLPVTLLVALCLLVGIIPGQTIGPFLSAAVTSVLGENKPYYSLAIWHGFNAPLVMSMIALIAGVALYAIFRDRINTNPRGAPPFMSRFQARRTFDATLAALRGGANALEQTLGVRRLQVQLRALVATALLGGGIVFLAQTLGWTELTLTPIDPAFAMLWVLGAACAIGAAVQAKYHRLVALILMGGAGMVSCLTFVWLSAPDLALTQMLVEIVTVVLLLLGLRWLPQRRVEMKQYSKASRVRAYARRGLDLGLAIGAGLGAAFLAFAVMTRPLGETISTFFLERSYADAGGRNVVNVLLVDFRAFDTFGEITVLGVVALTVFALLRRFRPAADSLNAPAQQIRQRAADQRIEHREEGDTLHDYLAIPRVLIQWLFPVILVFGIYLFLRGHDEPGGGFAAGVALSIAIILQYMASGARWVEARLRVLPVLWIGLGLLVAALTGLGAWFFNAPFLTSYFQYADIPILGRIPIASALLFDLGVMMLVVGATVLMLIALAHQSIRTPRVIERKPDDEEVDTDAAPAPDPQAPAPDAEATR